MNYFYARAISILFIVFLLANPASIHAQQSPDSTSVEEKAPVTLTEFVANINDATFRLENIRESLVDSAAVEQFLRNEHQFSNDVAELRLLLARLSQTRPSLLQLDDMSRHWDRLASTQGTWVDGLNDLAQSHGSESEWIDSVRDEWDHIVSVTEPDELTIYSDRVSVFFENVDEIDALLRAQLVQAVQIADNLALDGFVIEHSKRTIDKLKNDLRQRYMERDGNFLFLPTTADAEDGEISGRISERMIDARSAIVSFFEQSTSQIIYHISLLIGLLLLTQLVYRRRMRQRPQGDEQEDEDFRGAAHIISHPYSTAFLLAASATPIIYPYAPNSVYDLSSLVAIIPLVRLIPGMIPKGMIRPFYAFMGIYLVHELRGFLPIYSLPGRITLLLVTALLLAGLVRILRSESYREGIDSDRVASIIKWTLIVVLAFVGISLVGSVIGYLSLSDFLSEAVFSLIYTGLLLYTALQLLEGGWTVFIRSSFARRLRAIDHNASLFIGRGHTLLGLGAGFWWLYMLAYQFGFDVFVVQLIDGF